MAKHDYIRYIRKDFALYTVQYFGSMLTWSKEDILAEIERAIKEAKPVDAVKVVRCKDCRYYTHNKRRCDHPCLDWDVECYDHWVETEPNDFCSRGERRTE